MLADEVVDCHVLVIGSGGAGVRAAIEASQHGDTVLISKTIVGKGGTYRLSRAVRERVSFARHDLLAAAPFPAADLILCRNVLIYFTRAEQARVVARFAAVLPTNGVLVLGGTETLPIDPGLFQADLPEARIYRRTAAAVAT